MDADGDGDGCKQNAEIDRLNDENDGKKDRQPQQRNSQDLCFQRNGFMFTEIAEPIVMRIVFLNLVEDFIKSLADRCFRVPGRTAIDA